MNHCSLPPLKGNIMSEYNEGDLVEAVKGDTVIRGRISDIGQGPFIDIPDPWTGTLENADFTVTVIEKAAPALPTEPGWYLSNGGGGAVYLGVDGSWSDDRNYGVNPGEIARKHAPLTRLEPVPDTAKKVLDRVRTELLSTTFRDSLLGIEALNAAVVRTDLNNIAAEFGVTS